MERIKFIRLFFISGFCLLILGLLNLQIFKGSFYQELSKKNYIRLIPQEGMRGRIFDRNKEILIDNSIVYDLAIMPEESSMLDKSLENIANVLKKEAAVFRKNYEKEFISNFIPVPILKDISLKEALLLEENRFRFPEVLIRTRLQRRYPYGSLASHVIGYLGEIDPWRLNKLSEYGYSQKDTVGYGGIEEKYDYFLRPQIGGRSIQVDRKNRLVRIIGFKLPKNGKDLQLTIDLRIQKILERKIVGKKGTIILMDPYSGEILGMVSFPNFSPEDFLKKNPRLKVYLSDPESPLLNRAVGGLYPPGSIFKLVVATAALKLHKINLNTKFFCSGKISIGDRDFNCWQVHNEQDLLSAIGHSCNIFFYKTGILLGPEAIYNWALKFGFGQLTHIDLPYEEKGFIPFPSVNYRMKKERWSNGDTANFSIGQGRLLVTPLQAARMMAVFANGGYLVRPYIVKMIDDRDITKYQRRIVKIDIDNYILEVVNQGLKKVVSEPEGTASFLSNLPVSIAGKTGTAQVPNNQPHGWFVGFFPYEKPKYVICVLLENIGAGHYSAKLAGEIIQEMLAENLL